MQGSPLTNDQKTRFIKKLVLTGGNVSKACQVLKLSRTAIYEHKKNDPDFAALWDEAITAGIDELEQEARRRAFKGVRKPIYQRGVMVGHVQEYSDTLLMFLLKGKRPEIYKDKVDVNANIKGTLDVTLHDKIKKFYGSSDE